MQSIDAHTLEKLVLQFQAGDTTVGNKLFGSITEWLISYAKCFKSESDTPDIVQETLVSIYKSIHKFDPNKSHFLNWVSTILRNRHIDNVRKIRARILRHEHYSHIADTFSPRIMPREEGLLLALQKLSPEKRQAIELTYFDGLTNVEIAEKLDIPLGTIKARIRRGIVELRDHLIPTK